MNHRSERHQHRDAVTVHGFRPTGSHLQSRKQTKYALTYDSKFYYVGIIDNKGYFIMTVLAVQLLLY